MSNTAIRDQLDHLRRCLDVLDARGIAIERIAIPTDPDQGPRVHVHPCAGVRHLPGACYKLQSDRAGRRIEHHAAPLQGCQVRWTQPA